MLKYRAPDLNISLTSAEQLLARCLNPPTPVATFRATQSAALLSQKSQRLLTRCAVLEKVLDGGLSRGQILEISGPPGSPKEKLAINVVASFAETGDEIVFVDTLGTKTNSKQLVHYTKVHTLAELMLFMHHLPAFLISHSKVVTTSQLAVKMVNADGSPGTFDSGGRGTMLPQLGMVNTTYHLTISYIAYTEQIERTRVPPCWKGLQDYPISRWSDIRVCFSCLTIQKSAYHPLTKSLVKLLSSPKFPPGQTPTISEPYSIVRQNIL
ncbi:hypothetical protein GALMADRAFT_62743 [Galerina marginata CBS 339.88]|uniref:RecA family profile 1 domain-containing protein n=1 Tax=Galerina marginata (strain CBS 339.88) TaxID=685588 RepID=A0A067T9W9_GALM3|nr:hypothetical protein GALMADRAFT_62743 [Galerina marginata CBS 339.88]